jgi:UDP-N-acetylglucosamine transferase subunit ALG13
MIFVSLGTDKYQFNRLLEIIDNAVSSNEIKGPIFAQIGESDYIPKHFSYVNYLTFSELSEYIKNSDILILHAGVGTTLLTLGLGRIPILFPRLEKYSEHVDNHQLEFIKKIEQTKKCLVAYERNTLIDNIINYEDYAKELNLSTSTETNQLVDYLFRNYPKRI